MITLSLAEGEQVKIKDFGVFKTVTVEQRKSVNVSTGEEHIIPSHRKVVFVPAKEIASLVNEPFEMFETVELADDFVDIEENGNASADAEMRVEELDNIAIPVDESDILSDDDNPELSESPQNDAVTETVKSLTSIEDKSVSSEDDVATQDYFVGRVLQSPTESPESDGGINLESAQPENCAPQLEEQSYIVTDSSDVDNNDEGVEEKDKFSSPVTDTLESDEENFSVPEVASDSEEDFIIKRKSRFGWGFLTGFCVALVFLLVAGCAVWYFNLIDLSRYKTAVEKKELKAESILTDSSGIEIVEEQNNMQDTDDSAAILANDSEGKELASVVSDAGNSTPERNEKDDAVPTEPSDKKVYDTISKTRYLTTMAKQHYGNFHLWPYIYIENQAFLGHPDRIKPGTKVVIPPLSKYGVDPNNPADIAKAKKKGVEIYSRYK